MRDDYAAEVRDKHVTELDNVLYIIKALSISKPANISRKQTKFVTKLEVEKKIYNSYVSFDILTFGMYSNNNGNMVVGEIPEFL